MLFTKALPALLFALTAMGHAIPALEPRQTDNATSISFYAADPDSGDYTPPNPGEADAQGFHYFDPADMVDANSVSFVKRGPASETVGYAMAAFWAAAMLGASEPERRGKFVEVYVDMLSGAFKGRNVIVFKRYIGFTIWVQDRSRDFTEITYTFVDDKSGIKTHFGVITFKGRGTLKRNKADGGWQNWGFSGNWQSHDNHRRIEFY